MPSRILILSNGPLCRNPRVVKEAEALAGAGHEVRVLTVRNHASSEVNDRAMLAHAPYQRQVIDMLPGFETSAAVVAMRRLRLRLMRDAAIKFGWKSIHALGPAGPLLRAAMKIPTDLVIAHNEIAHWAGGKLMTLGRRVAADIEDWHSEDLLPDDRKGRPLKLLRRQESALLHQAAYVSTTSHALADALHAAYGGRRPKVITNSFPLPALPKPATDEAPPAFFWFSQTTGPGRGLESFLAAYARVAAPSRLILLGEVRGGYDQYLLGPLPESHRTRVSFMPLVSPQALPEFIARHDIGLALEQASIRNRDLTITNKILQYLGAGLAVVATPTAGQREVLAHSPDAGLILRDLADTAATATALQDLIVQPSVLRLRQAAARKLAEDHYCWEREAPRLVAMVNQSLNTRT
ncbi:MAG: glycosyltransferase [Opitutaceae bacterium]|nr:glycosyltransferase [Opitutaceae bacterium]